jgi:acetyl esterase/lipase
METKKYKKVDGYKLTVDIFSLPETPDKDNNPAIAFFHGGGWVFGSKEEFHGACKRYAAKGFITFSFQYRLSIKEDGEYPHPDITLVECVKDAKSAVRWMRENAKKLKIDPSRIVVGGQSGGGQMTLGTALCDDINEDTDDLRFSAEPNAMLLYSSCYNTLEPWIDMIMADRRHEIWSVSPYHNIKKGMPPTLAFHGGKDCMVLYYSVEFFKWKMDELGNPFELITLDGRDHYLGEGNDFYSNLFDEGIMKRTDVFLEKCGFLSSN